MTLHETKCQAVRMDPCVMDNICTSVHTKSRCARYLDHLNDLSSMKFWQIHLSKSNSVKVLYTVNSTRCSVLQIRQSETHLLLVKVQSYVDHEFCSFKLFLAEEKIHKYVLHHVMRGQMVDNDMPLDEIDVWGVFSSLCYSMQSAVNATKCFWAKSKSSYHLVQQVPPRYVGAHVPFKKILCPRGYFTFKLEHQTPIHMADLELGQIILYGPTQNWVDLIAWKDNQTSILRSSFLTIQFSLQKDTPFLILGISKEYVLLLHSNKHTGRTCHGNCADNKTRIRLATMASLMSFHQQINKHLRHLRYVFDLHFSFFRTSHLVSVTPTFFFAEAQVSQETPNPFSMTAVWLNHLFKGLDMVTDNIPCTGVSLPAQTSHCMNFSKGSSTHDFSPSYYILFQTQNSIMNTTQHSLVTHMFSRVHVNQSQLPLLLSWKQASQLCSCAGGYCQDFSVKLT